LTVVISVSDHVSTGPRTDLLQSKARMRPAISPAPIIREPEMGTLRKEREVRDDNGMRNLNPRQHWASMDKNSAGGMADSHHNSAKL
jgi:hypothetical protein